jgi:hypothetical protein
MCVQPAKPCGEQTNDADIEITISKLKNGKANRHDQILAKLITEGGKQLKKVIYELI